MSVLCCQIPHFLIQLYTRRHPDAAGRPLALLGGDERVWAVSAEAQSCDVLPQMSPRQAQMRCPDLLLRPLESDNAQAEQQAFLHTLARWELPVESIGWGAAYLDLHTVATRRPQVAPLCVEMGRSVRQQLGESLQPSIGWDSGKFTAQAAAVRTPAGHIRLIDKQNEVGFLHPLPVELLPLPPAALQRLGWLGIRTLGQFAALPQISVQQRFGPEGKLAWQWAQGRDNRPVAADVSGPPPTFSLAFDPPAERMEPVLVELLAALDPQRAALARQLLGIRRLRLDLGFLDGSERVIDLALVEPVPAPGPWRTLLERRLAGLVWPGALERIQGAILQVGELPLPQQTLFPELLERSEQPLAELCKKLGDRYGPVFFTGSIQDAQHPLPERRAVFHVSPLA